MKVTFKNIGVVKEATIDLSKKLNIFCGANNTGKTYLTYAVYGLLKQTAPFFQNSLSQKEVKKLIQKEAIKIELNQDIIHKYRKLNQLEFGNNLDSIFGLSKKETFKFFKDISVIYDDLHLEVVDTQANIKFDDSEFEFEFKKNDNDNFIQIKLLKISDNFNFEKNEGFINHILYYILHEIITKYPIKNTHILPVERNSIYTFSKELSLKRNDLIDQLQNFSSDKDFNSADFLEKRTTRYPLAIRDGLKMANDLGNIAKQESEFAEFAKQIETELLEGVVSTNQYGDVVFAPNKAKTKKLPIHLAASVVKSLSHLTFYLKHIAKKGDLIIIDEPELNLHPDNQIRLARIFAKLINKDFRLLISTHSDYIIRELNNLIMISEDTETIKAIAKEHGYAEDEKISPDDVGAYLFKYTTKTKVKVEQIPVTQTGFEVETINDAINELNQRSQELYYYLKEEENE